MRRYTQEYILEKMDNGSPNALKELMLEIGYPNIWSYVHEHLTQIEIISDVLTDDEKTWQTLENVLNFLIENGAYTKPISGGHIHVGKQILKEEPLFWANFLMLWQIFENYIIKFTNGENYFSRDLKFAGADFCSGKLKKLINDIKNECYDKKLDLLSDKVYSLNFSNDTIGELIFEYGDKENDKANTIEVRCPNGTLNKVVWQNNVNFICKMLLSCASSNFDYEYLNYLYKKYPTGYKGVSLNINNYLEFALCDLVFDNEFDKLCFLRQYYKDFNEPKQKDVLLKSKPFWK